MTHPKIPKHLISKVQRTGYGYISDDNMYRLFRYKWRHSYHQKEPQRWMLMKPDGDMEYFETMVEGRQRIYELQETSGIKEEEKKAKEEKEKRKAEAERKKKIKEQKDKRKERIKEKKG